ncbi:MAG: hypothetical protein ACRD3R_06615, partial [Terriglobales bacterium]
MTRERRDEPPETKAARLVFEAANRRARFLRGALDSDYFGLEAFFELADEGGKDGPASGVFIE